MGEHTPGPWKVIGNPPTEILALGDSREGIVVADTEFFGREATPRQIADARLIAAAPDLLAALVNLAEYVEDDNPGAASCDAHVMALLEAAHDAIARARGEASDAAAE